MRRWVGLLIVLVVAAGGGVAAALRTIETPFQGYEGGEQFVEIAPGTGTSAIGDQLARAGVVSHPLVFRVALWRTGQARVLKAGDYQFTRPLSAREVVGQLARGEVYSRTITFREGLTLREMAQHFSAQGFGTASEFLEAAHATALISDLDPAATDLEGYLFPDTYALSRRASADDLIVRMVTLFRQHYDGAMFNTVRRAGFTTREIVTLASLVEKETARADERPLVAAVYRNRWKIGMGMQADPTVIYALVQRGTYTGNLTRADLQVDSPYNTYRYRGLPPGPIAAPGLASLQAAVQPAAVSHLYFVSRNDGSHVFADALDEHNRNVRRWQVDYFRQRRQANRQAR
jgi:UPF0755 protein